MPFTSHQLRLYLDKQLYLALIKLQADKELGRSYAGLLIFNEGLHQLGYINQKQYETHKKRYSIPLTKDPQQVTLEEHESIHKRKKLNEQFLNVIEQFSAIKPHARDYWIRKARENGELDNARRLLALVEERKVVS